MALTKAVHTKKSPAAKKAPKQQSQDEEAIVAGALDHEDEAATSPKGKLKKGLETDAHEPLIPLLPEIDEKVVDDEVAVTEAEDEEAEETPSLDEDDVNPFGDKWEM